MPGVSYVCWGKSQSSAELLMCKQIYVVVSEGTGFQQLGGRLIWLCVIPGPLEACSEMLSGACCSVLHPVLQRCWVICKLLRKAY